MKISEDRVGLKKKNSFGLTMEVIEYKNYNNILVQFEQGEIIRAEWSQFKKGTLRSPYEKTIFGIGYLGEGKYKSKVKEEHSPQYKTWYQMFVRCYDKKYQEKYPTYIGCIVAEEWHNYQTFATWYDENIYHIEGERLELDKDILMKGNKIYSPETCVFVPRSINSLFTKRNSLRGTLPIGVHWCERDKSYVAQCMDGKGNKKGLGHHNAPLEAFNAYKSFKEQLIKQIAEENKNRIPNNLYEALMKYQVEITD
jgi:hypothetical protein